MNFDHLEALHAVRDLGLRLQPSDVAAVDVSVHPAFTAIRTVQSVVEPEDIPVALGAQDCATEDSGAFTGEVSPPMLAKLHVRYVIVGHSERRRLFGETDELVLAKLKAVLRNGMTPICCVGETEDERERGVTHERLAEQVGSALGPLPAEAVGRHGHRLRADLGHRDRARPPRPRTPRRRVGWIREVVAGSAGAEVAEAIRIQYGGSVQAENTESLVELPQRRWGAGRRGEPGPGRLRRHRAGRGPGREVNLVASPATGSSRRKTGC